MSLNRLDAVVRLRTPHNGQSFPEQRLARTRAERQAWPQTDTLVRVRHPVVPELKGPRDWVDDAVDSELDAELEPVVLHWLRQLETISGMGVKAAANKQLRWLEERAREAGVSVGRYVAGEVAANGYGGATAQWWTGLTTAERDAWRDRAETIFARLEREAPAEIKRLLRNAAAAGGGIKFLPKEVEQLGENTYAFRRGDVLGVGKAWLEDAERSLADVYANIAHELGGHLEYGDPLSWLVAKLALSMLPVAEREIAKSGARSVYSAYAYMETEIYAELREQAFRLPDSGGDAPVNDVPRQLARMQKAFEPSVALAVVRTLRQRVQADPKVTAEGKQLLDDAIARVFGLRYDDRALSGVA